MWGARCAPTSHMYSGGLSAGKQEDRISGRTNARRPHHWMYNWRGGVRSGCEKSVQGSHDILAQTWSECVQSSRELGRRTPCEKQADVQFTRKRECQVVWWSIARHSVIIGRSWNKQTQFFGFWRRFAAHWQLNDPRRFIYRVKAWRPRGDFRCNKVNVIANTEGWPLLQELQVWYFRWLPPSQGLGDEIKQDLLLLEGTGRVLFARVPHGSGAGLLPTAPCFRCRCHKSINSGCNNTCTMALGEVPAIIAGDIQGHPAEQSDQMSCAMRRGWLVDEGWEHRSPQTGCPAPTYVSGGAETRIDYVLTNRVAHCMFRMFRVDEHTWVPKHRAIFFWVGDTPFHPVATKSPSSSSVGCSRRWTPGEHIPGALWTEHLDGNPSRLEVFKNALGTSGVTLAWRTLSSNMAEAMAKQTNGSVKHAMTKGRAPHFVNQDQSRGCKRCVGETNSYARAIARLRNRIKDFRDRLVHHTRQMTRQWELHCTSGRQAGSVREILSLGTASHSIGQKAWESLAQTFCRRFVLSPSGLDLKSFPSQTTLQTLEEHCQSALESHLQERETLCVRAAYDRLLVSERMGTREIFRWIRNDFRPPLQTMMVPDRASRGSLRTLRRSFGDSGGQSFAIAKGKKSSQFHCGRSFVPDMENLCPSVKPQSSQPRESGFRKRSAAGIARPVEEQMVGAVLNGSSAVLNGTSSVRKFYLEHSPEMSCVRGGIWKGDISVADIEELERMDASEIHARRLHATEVITPQNGEAFTLPSEDGKIKLSGGDQVLRTSTLIRDSPERGEEREVLGGEPDGSPTTRLIARWRWSAKRLYINRHHVEPRVKLHVPREESFPMSLRYIDVTRATSMTLDVLLERRIDDYWNIEEDRDLSDAWTGSTRFTLLNEKPPDECTWSGERLTKTQTTSRPELWKNMSNAAQRKKSRSLPSRNRCSTMQESCEVFLLLIRQTRSSRKLSKQTHGKSWKFWWEQPCFARSEQVSSGKLVALLAYARQNTHASWKPTNIRESVWKELYIKIMKTTLQENDSIDSLNQSCAQFFLYPTKFKQNLLVFWKLMNPPECVWGILNRIITKTILQEEERIHYSTTIWFTNLFLCLKQWKYQKQASSSGKRIGKTTSGANEES